ncbi:MAG: DUF4124 domain-containing protein [Gammaproteobacteria bacterium]|nr:DUF4124 domain-containing protein [Gammaproteobacteria bacterium]
MDARWFLVPGVMLFLSTAQAEKVYKWVDEQGNVTYQSAPPPTGSGQVEKKDIDPNRNVIKADHPLPDYSSAPPPAPPAPEQKRPPAKQPDPRDLLRKAVGAGG